MNKNKNLGLLSMAAGILILVGCGSETPAASPAGGKGLASGRMELTPLAETSDIATLAADLNGDGYQDLIVLTVPGPLSAIQQSTVSVYYGPLAGASRPAPAELYTMPPQATSLAVGDLNGDGIPDLLVGLAADWTHTPASQGGVRILFRGPTGGSTDVLVGLDTDSVRTTDVDGDGNIDVLASGSGYLYICRGLGAGTFEDAYHLRLAGPWTVGDFSEDGRACVAMRNGVDVNQVDVLSWDVVHGEICRTTVSFDAPVVLLSAADVNGDGRQDLVVGGCDGISVALRHHPFAFQPAVKTASPGGAGVMTLGDFNGDGNIDVCLSASCNGGALSLLLGDGTGSFTASVTPPPALVFHMMASADLNGDGRSDLISCGDETAVVFSGQAN
jgi:hypothetical protein